MLHFFGRDPDHVRWELAASGSGGCRLVVHYSQGTIVETFANAAQALRRVQQLENYLDTQVAQGTVRWFRYLTCGRQWAVGAADAVNN